MRVNVRKVDIAKGIPNSPWRCPIALALKRILALDYIEVNQGDVRFSNSRKRTKIELPDKAQAFIEKFDRGDSVMPFAFEL